MKDELLELDKDLIYRYEGRPFTGIGCEHWPNGRLSSERSFVDGMQDGWSREWSENGTLTAEVYYRKGWEVGTSKEWHINGAPKSEKKHEHGLLIESKEWDESGRLVSEYDIRNDSSNFPLLQQARRAEEGRQ